MSANFRTISNPSNLIGYYKATVTSVSIAARESPASIAAAAPHSALLISYVIFLASRTCAHSPNSLRSAETALRSVGSVFTRDGPDTGVIDNGVAMNQQISEGNDFLNFRDSPGQIAVGFRQQVQGFTDDLELPFDR